MSFIPDKKIVFDQLKDEFFRLDKFSEEWSLFIARKNTRHPAYKTRFEAWESHINKGCELENVSRRPPLENIGGERVILLNKLLGIIDTKIGMLLSTNSFLLAAVGLGRVWLTDLLNRQSCHPYSQVVETVASYTSLGIVLFLLLASLSVAIRGFRRVVWGNLKNTPTPETGPDEEEIKHTGFLIMSVARRTNKFRISCKLLELALFAIMLFLCCCGTLFVINILPATSCDPVITSDASMHDDLLRLLDSLGPKPPPR